MRLALLPNLTRKLAAETTREICRWLREYGAEYAATVDTARVLSDIENLQRMPFHELIDWCDAIIAVGGDGSMLMAAKDTVDYGKPILCINAGRLAFMAGLERDELEQLKRLIDGNYYLDRRMLIECVVTRDGNEMIHTHCINDVVLARGKELHMGDINVDCNGHRVNTYHADGIIVATPTGSSAYSLSAGGPVIDPGIDAIVVTPICPQSLLSRPTVFNSNSTITVSIDKNSPNNHDLYLSCDGADSVHIQVGDQITITKSPKYSEFIRIKNDSFFDILNNKFASEEVTGLEAKK